MTIEEFETLVKDFLLRIEEESKREDRKNIWPWKKISEYIPLEKHLFYQLRNDILEYNFIEMDDTIRKWLLKSLSGELPSKR